MGGKIPLSRRREDREGRRDGGLGGAVEIDQGRARRHFGELLPAGEPETERDHDRRDRERNRLDVSAVALARCDLERQRSAGGFSGHYSHRALRDRVSSSICCNSRCTTARRPWQ